MAEKHELEITIAADGRIEVTVIGAKGKKCLDYVEIFQQVGQVVKQTPTSEYYEPETPAGLFQKMFTRKKQG